MTGAILTGALESGAVRAEDVVATTRSAAFAARRDVEMGREVVR